MPDCSGLCGGKNKTCGCTDRRACNFVFNATTDVVDGSPAHCIFRDTCQVRRCVVVHNVQFSHTSRQFCGFGWSAALSVGGLVCNVWLGMSAYVFLSKQVCGGDNSTCKVGASSRCNASKACNFNPATQQGEDPGLLLCFMCTHYRGATSSRMN